MRGTRMERAVAWSCAAMLAVLLTGCPGAARPAIGAMDEMERARTSPAAKEGASLAPQEYGRAEQERELSKRAYEAGDDLGAALHAERATAAYQHALVLARLAKAQRENDDATAALRSATDQLRTLETQRADVERDAEALDKQVKVARELLLPAASGPSDPAREEARLVAARALAMQARLLCGSARLLVAAAPGLEDAERELADVEKQLEKPAAKNGPLVDAAGRSRAACLASLTKARRGTQGGGSATHADALLAELSASAGWDPTRDERGVVVALRNAFQGTALSTEGATKLKELARIAAAHPTFGVQVVLHDATAPTPAEAAANKQRVDAAVKALVDGGVAASKVKGEAAGARAPVVDPADAKGRGRNARLEIVFVAP